MVATDERLVGRGAVEESHARLSSHGTSMSNPKGHSGCRKLTSESTTTSPVTSISSLPELRCTDMWPGV